MEDGNGRYRPIDVDTWENDDIIDYSHRSVQFKESIISAGAGDDEQVVLVRKGRRNCTEMPAARKRGLPLFFENIALQRVIRPMICRRKNHETVLPTGVAMNTVTRRPKTHPKTGIIREAILCDGVGIAVYRVQ